MKHLVMSKPQCMLYSAAMVLDMEVDELITLIGHNGMEKIDDNGEPYCFASIHIQEIQTVAARFGRCFYPIDLIPVMGHLQPRPLYKICGQDYAVRFLHMVKGKKGLLCGRSVRDVPHTVAFEDETIYDPNGTKYPLGQFRTQTAWILGEG